MASKSESTPSSSMPMIPGTFSATTKSGRTSIITRRISGQRWRSSAAPRRCPAKLKGWQGNPPVMRVMEDGRWKMEDLPSSRDSCRACPPVATALAWSAVARLVNFSASATSSPPCSKPFRCLGCFAGRARRLAASAKVSPPNEGCPPCLCASRRRILPCAASATIWAVTFRMSPRFGTSGHHCLRILHA